MGCDIHMIAEIKDKSVGANNQEWRPLLDPIFKDRYFDKKEPICRWNIPYTFQPYADRNYEVFSVLANVRNGWGIKPIDEARGYPEDMHAVSKWLLDGYDYVDHSPSWLSLDEVLAYDWNGTESNYFEDGKTLKDSARRFLENMELLKKYAEDEDCEVRLVFGFDS